MTKKPHKPKTKLNRAKIKNEQTNKKQINKSILLVQTFL